MARRRSRAALPPPPVPGHSPGVYSQDEEMSAFWGRWTDFPDYILGITQEIWEGRGIGTLREYYSDDIPLRTPMGVVVGNEAVIRSTMATCFEFSDRQLLGEDVIWSDDPVHGLLSSHRVLTYGTHTAAGQFGPASGKRFCIRVIADCAARDGVIYDEWLVRDYGGLVRQLGMDPAEVARGLIEGGGAAPFTPERDVAGDYGGRGNENAWGARYADLMHAVMRAEFSAIESACDRAMSGHYPGARDMIGRVKATEFWMGLRSAFPSARFEIHHQIGMEEAGMPPRAALRWSLDGIHDGWGAFGRPTGARVHVMGMSHAEFGPRGLRRECALFDEVAIWQQILMRTG